MNRHLGEHEITTAIVGLELDAASAAHLASCVSCSQRVAAMREAIDGRKRNLEAESPDWDRQHQEVMRRLPSAAVETAPRRRLWARPMLAVAAIVVAVVGLKALWAPAPDPVGGAELPVEEILAEVDAVLADDSIPGFELIDPGLEDAIYENGAS
jgi:anti-sigma factor RsiW